MLLKSFQIEINSSCHCITKKNNLKEIGEVLGVSESRVSQILSQNVKKLGNILFEEETD